MSTVTQASSQNPVSGNQPEPAKDSPTVIAWRHALDTYRKSLTDKDLKQIQVPTGPEDVVATIEKWQNRQKTRKSEKIASPIRACTGRMQRFNACLDLIAQGTPQPGCLLWGSIRFVLKLVHDAAEEYERLCEALIRMVEYLPRVELYTDTFLDSELVKECVHAFYVSVLRFWTRACKFYRRRRFWNIIRVFWNDFEFEFKDLEVEMNRNRERIEAAATAKHIEESKLARVQQSLVNLELIESEKRSKRKEINAWLAPVAYDVGYYVHDLEIARELYLPGTCQWITEKDCFRTWSTSSDSRENLLWVIGKPGAGKTILVSYLIDWCRKNYATQDGNVLYFFCKNTDNDKNTATAVIRSLLYQLSRSNIPTLDLLNSQIDQELEKSGQRRAVNFAVLWALFSTHIRKLQNAILLLDALDECQEPESLIEGLKSLVVHGSVKVLLTSRHERHLVELLETSLSFEMRTGDVDCDIRAFVVARVSENARLSNPLVRDLVLEKLTGAHNGMFLWVYLMMKELKTCISVPQVKSTLENLPEGLHSVYKRVLSRLRATLNRASLEICQQVLTWVVTAIRPLKIAELQEALAMQYHLEGHTLLAEGECFPYSKRDLELICGSLVSIRDETIQLIHLSTKEFLQQSFDAPDDGDGLSRDLLVNPRRANLKLTEVCLAYLSVNCVEPLVDIQDKSERKYRRIDESKLRSHLQQKCLLEYACFGWLTHVLDCDVADSAEAANYIWRAFDSPSTFCWIETCMLLDRNSIWSLLIGLEEMGEWISAAGVEGPSVGFGALDLVRRWASATAELFEKYREMCLSQPWEVYILDLNPLFRRFGLESFYQQHAEKISQREVESEFGENSQNQGFQDNLPKHLQLHIPLGDFRFVFDHGRDVFLATQARENYLTIHVQQASTGLHLPPITDFIDLHGISFLDTVLSSDGKYLGIAGNNQTDYFMSVWKIKGQLEFKRRIRSGAWARKIAGTSCPQDPGCHPVEGAAAAFGDDGTFYSFAGEIDVISGTTRPLRAKCSFSSSFQVRLGSRFAISGNGHFVFVFGHGPDFQVTRFSALDKTSTALSLSKQEYSEGYKYTKMCHVSHSGRYAVVIVAHRKPSNHKLLIYDWVSSKCHKLRSGVSVPQRCCRLRFSHDEMRLYGFFLDTGEFYTIVIDSLETSPRVRESYHEWWMAHGFNISTIEVQEALWVASHDLKLYRLDLRPGEIDLSCFRPENNPVHVIYSTVSRDGTRFCQLLQHEAGEVTLRVFNVHSPPLPERVIHLGHDDGGLKQISGDLKYLIFNSTVFHIENAGCGNSPLPLTIDSQTKDFFRHTSRWSFSCCRPFACSMSSKEQSQIHLFKIDLILRLCTKVIIPLAESWVYWSADFHPSLPFLAILGHRVDRSAPAPSLFILNLDTMTLECINPSPISIDVPINELSCRFSNDGTFIYLSNRDNLLFKPPNRGLNNRSIVHRLGIPPLATPAFLACGFHCCFGDEVYSFHKEDGELYIFFGRFHENRISYLDLTACQIGSYCDYYLHLGNSEHDLMFVLSIPENGMPPRIKNLLLTFAEAKAILRSKLERGEYRVWR